MERLSVKTRIAAMLSRFRLHLRSKRAYSLGAGMLLLLAFIAGGIFMHSAYAASSSAASGPAKVGSGGYEKKGEDSAYGRITGIHGETITIQYDGKTTKIITSDKTMFADKIERKIVTLGSLKVGDFVYAGGKFDSNGSLAASVVVVAPPPSSSGGYKKSVEDSLAGRITGIHGTTITIEKSGKTATVDTNAATTFINKIVGGYTTLGHLKVGNFVIAVGKFNSDSSLAATAIYLITAPN